VAQTPTQGSSLASSQNEALTKHKKLMSKKENDSDSDDELNSSIVKHESSENFRLVKKSFQMIQEYLDQTKGFFGGLFYCLSFFNFKFCQIFKISLLMRYGHALYLIEETICLEFAKQQKKARKAAKNSAAGKFRHKKSRSGTRG